MREYNLLETLLKENPFPDLVKIIVNECSKILKDRSLVEAYSNMEIWISSLERWLWNVWSEMYERLANVERKNWSIERAFTIAWENNANILISDGFSLRELVVLLSGISEKVNRYEIGYAPPPTTTTNVAQRVFGEEIMKNVFKRRKLVFRNKVWESYFIKDIVHPPRIGKMRGVVLFTPYPDLPLHEAKKYGVELHNLDEVIKKLIKLIIDLSSVSPLVVTGDHGYIFVGDSPAIYLWKWKKSRREAVLRNGHSITIGGSKVAIGRFHAPQTKRRGSLIVHGGISIMESLVPIVIVRGG